MTLRRLNFRLLGLVAALWALASTSRSVQAAVVEVEGQPLAANVERLIKAMDFLGTPIQPDLSRKLAEAGTARDAATSTAGSALPSGLGGVHSTRFGQPAIAAGTASMMAAEGRGAVPAGT